MKSRDIAEAVIVRRNGSAAEMLIESLDISEEDATGYVREAREWLDANDSRDPEAIYSLDIAIRAAHFHGMHKRLEN